MPFNVASTPVARRPWSAVLAVAALVCGADAALAGRPLSVDDANVNDTGAGHVEMWAAHAPGSTVLNVAPAFAPIDGVELAVALGRDTKSKVNTSTLQLKWRITPSQEAGCNVATSFGATRISDGGGHQRFLNGLATCNFGGQGSIHFNVGVVKPSGEGSVKTWGVAYEREMGALTPHVEFFGAKGSKPTAQVGARTKLTEA